MSKFMEKIAEAVGKNKMRPFPTSTAPADNVSLASALRAIYDVVFGTTAGTGIGSTFWLKKNVTSGDILTASAVDITGVSTTGELEIEQIIIKSDATGLAGGTNFELKSNNANGLANILVETVANLGANKTVNLDTASVTKTKTVLETGKKLQVQNTGAVGTGAGVITIQVKLRRLTAGATIAVL